MEVTAQTVRTLEALLIRECQLYADYLEALIEERKWVTKFDSDKLTHTTARRAMLYDAMLDAQNQRIEIMRGFRESAGLNLRGLISKHFPAADAKRLLPLCEDLRALVEKIRRRSREHSQIVDFGLKMAHGLLSLFWSTTQSVFKSYDRTGSLQKAYHSGASRLQGVLKQA
jgi:hypothetical protein